MKLLTPDELRVHVNAAWRIKRETPPTADLPISGPSVEDARRERSRDPLDQLKSFRTLQSLDFPPIRWVVPGFLPEGLTILMGAPKVGKSWLVLGMAKAVGSGGAVLGQKCEQGSVLLLALEDNDRRLQDRLDLIAGEEQWPEDVAYTTQWPRLDEGGLNALMRWIDQTPNARLVIIDTLAMVKPTVKGKGGNAYDLDVQALRGLHQLASRQRVSIVIVTHKRKLESDDPLEGISGTNGLTGTADSTVALVRGPGGQGHVLYGRGRDLSEFERAVKLVDGCWQVEGDPLEAFAGDSRKAILRAIREGASAPKDIARVTNLAPATVRQNLGRMVNSGQVIKSGYGEYTLSHLSHCHTSPSEL